MRCVLKGAIAATLVVVLSFGMCGWHASATAAEQTVEDMVNSLSPRVRRGLPDAQRTASPTALEAKAALSRYLAIRSRRGPDMKERKELYEALKPMPQLNILTIYFSLDSAEVEPTSLATLEKIGAAITNERLMTSQFVIAGHTDQRGTAEYNLDLSQRRAETVRHLLIERFHIDPHRLNAIGHGFEELADPEHPLSAKNRRVQIVNLVK
jgi:outer membrane protein OmpA-like peptidoglycan-associated protein